MTLLAAIDNGMYLVWSLCVWYVRMVFQHFLDRHWERKKEKNPKEIKSMPNERVTHTHTPTYTFMGR